MLLLRPDGPQAVCLEISPGLIVDPWRDSGSGRAGFDFAALPLWCFVPSCVCLWWWKSLKNPSPSASNLANAARSGWCLGSAFEVLGKDRTSRGEALQSEAVTSSCACCFFVAVAVGLQVNSLFAGWCFLTWEWSKAKSWSGSGSVQLGSDLPQALSLRAWVGSSRLTLLLALMLPRKVLSTLLLTGHLPCCAPQQQWHSWKAGQTKP